MKEETRRLVIARRNAIPSDERIARSVKACEELERYFSHTIASESRIAAYHALGSEVDIVPFTKSAHMHGWTCAFPVMMRDDNDAKARMTFWDVPLDGTRRAFFDKPARAVTPDDSSLAGCTPCNPREIDAVIVPMAAATSTASCASFEATPSCAASPFGNRKSRLCRPSRTTSPYRRLSSPKRKRRPLACRSPLA